MSFFRWTAPLFKLCARRWSDEDLRELAGRLRPYAPPGSVFLDIGGGTGDLGAGIAAALQAEVIVADATAQMLRRVSPRPFVSVRLAAAEALPFPDGTFSAVLCSDAFHHFRDQATAAREMARVLRPGGGVLFLEMHRRGAGGTFLSVVERMLREPAAFLEPAELQALLGNVGIVGTTEERGGISYLFLGTRRSP